MFAIRMKTSVLAVGGFAAFFAIGLCATLWYRSAADIERSEPHCGMAVSDAPDDGLVFIHGGRFRLGAAGIYAEETPVQETTVAGFWISSHDVTNAQFARFVKETGYVTIAERGATAQDYPGAQQEWLQPGGAVFQMPLKTLSQTPLGWWHYVRDANWRHPQGPHSSIEGRMNHPVVQLAYADAQAYTHWAGLQLPTEAQWEYAARGGVDGSTYPWGNELNPGGRVMANTWQGEFPFHNTRADGFAGTSPVGCFPANGYGLYDMVGNVWQWTSDWYFPDHRLATAQASAAPASTAVDAAKPLSFDPQNPDVPSRVIKGGSFLCASNYCMRYRPAARQPHDAGLGTDHIGFRTVRNAAD